LQDVLKSHDGPSFFTEFFTEFFAYALFFMWGASFEARPGDMPILCFARPPA